MTTKTGRPPKGQIVGKRENFATRITSEMRQSLDAEAERTGRSVSQVAELWLEDGRSAWFEKQARIRHAEFVQSQMLVNLATPGVLR